MLMFWESLVSCLSLVLSVLGSKSDFVSELIPSSFYHEVYHSGESLCLFPRREKLTLQNIELLCMHETNFLVNCLVSLSYPSLSWWVSWQRWCPLGPRNRARTAEMRSSASDKISQVKHLFFHARFFNLNLIYQVNPSRTIPSMVRASCANSIPRTQAAQDGANRFYGHLIIQIKTHSNFNL